MHVCVGCITLIKIIIIIFWENGQQIIFRFSNNVVIHNKYKENIAPIKIVNEHTWCLPNKNRRTRMN